MKNILLGKKLKLQRGAQYLEEMKMLVKVIKKMEALRGFIHIPTKSRFEFIGNISLPCATLLNGNKARLDKYGRLWCNWLKGRFRVGSCVRLSRNREGFQIETVKENSLENSIPSAFESSAESLGLMDYKAECLKKFKKLGDIWVPKVIVGDIRKVAHYLPDNFIDCIITSPPYWMQRDYNHPEQIGREETPQKYAEEIVTVFENLRPKLKKTATI
ncbi:MAG: DNA methyltransferase, partial [Candidatus Bathyarchaeia archaeon]